MALSFIGAKGLSTTKLLDLVVNSLYDQFVEKDIKELDAFNVGIVETINTINMALPGKHYVTPSSKDVKDMFELWKETNKEDKKKIFTKFIDEKVNLNNVDASMLTTALVAPPAAMMAKKTGQVVPQLALMNAIPDVLFVPSATLLALIATKIIGLTFVGKTASKDTKRSPVIEEPKKPSPPLPPEEPLPPPEEPLPLPEPTPFEEPSPPPPPSPEPTPLEEPSPPPEPTQPSTPPGENPQPITEQDVAKYKHLLEHKHTGNIICPLCNKYYY